MSKKRVVFDDNSTTIIKIQDEGFFGKSLKVYIDNKHFSISSENDVGMIVSSQFGKKIKRIEDWWKELFPQNTLEGFSLQCFF